MAALATVLASSTVMTVLGQLTAVVVLLPSLGLLVQQFVASANDSPRIRGTQQVEGSPEPEAREGPQR
ncbi:hypothetical protein [Streptomyces sp. NPDC058612]|uniref:hypothetical protein n=1 Tax=Streptomyces sp. NPDC058612 TaxID=3346555 RepID=UPI00365E6097